jgi:hypothetical protein
VGRLIRLNGHPATIAGVAAKDFLGVMPMMPADIFLPTTAPSETAPELSGDVLRKTDAKVFSVVFRLAPGVTADTAEIALDSLAQRLDQSTLDPARYGKGRRIHMIPAGGVLPLPKTGSPHHHRHVQRADGPVADRRVHESGQHAAGPRRCAA